MAKAIGGLGFQVLDVTAKKRVLDAKGFMVAKLSSEVWQPLGGLCMTGFLPGPSEYPATCCPLSIMAVRTTNL